MSKEKNLELERLVFFSDAVVAIAITLLALDLKIEKEDLKTALTFKDIANLWTKFSAFFLSFILIAVFWKIHHNFFAFVKKIDKALLWYNIFWLLFIIILPFSTTLVSAYFGQTVSVFIYCINTLLITIFQNQIWDYVAVRPDYLNDKADEEVVYDYRFDCNIAMINAAMAAALSFVSPVAAFLILFARPLMMRTLKRPWKRRFKEQKQVQTEDKSLDIKNTNAGNFKDEKALSKPYLFIVLLLTIVLPLLSVVAEYLLSKNQHVLFDVIAKWFIFWTVGMRLFLAGLRQTFNPSFTAETIFHIRNKESYVIVRELGFANICFGVIGIISLFLPQWRMVSAVGSGLFYGIAGINHIIKKPAGLNEVVAMVSDNFIFICLVIYVVIASNIF